MILIQTTSGRSIPKASHIRRVPKSSHRKTIIAVADEIKNDNFNQIDLIKDIADEVEKIIIDERILIETALIYMFSAFTPKPLNGCLSSTKSSAKSRLLLAILSFFDHDDKIIFERVSPKSFAYGGNSYYEIETDTDCTQIVTTAIKEAAASKKAEARIKRDELLEKYKQCVNYENKIVVILENPGSKFLASIRPVLSHDDWFILSKIVHEGKALELSTRGWPSFIYVTADSDEEYEDLKVKEQVQSRFDIFGTSATAEKMDKVFDMKAEEQSELLDLNNINITNGRVIKIQETIREIRDELHRLKNAYFELGIPYTKTKMVVSPYAKSIFDTFPREDTSEMRIGDRITYLLDTITLMYMFNRPYVKIGGLKQFISVENDFNQMQRVANEFEFLSNTDTKEQEIIKKVLIPFFYEKDREGTLDNWKPIEGEDVLTPRFKKDEIIKYGVENHGFVKRDLKERLEIFSNKNILDSKTGPGGGVACLKTKEELEQMASDSSIITLDFKNMNSVIDGWFEDINNDPNKTLVMGDKELEKVGVEDAQIFKKKYYPSLTAHLPR